VFSLKGNSEKYSFGDLCMDNKGNIYITDSRYNAIFKYDIQYSYYEEFTKPGTFISLQGIDFDEKSNCLYAADYSLGIAKIELDSLKLHFYEPAQNNTILGIDGLYYYNNSLICIQNGTTPHRVIRISFNQTKDSIKSIKILASNLPGYDEPTLGLIKDNKFIYIANSQWNKFNNSGEAIDSTQATIILSTELK
jgi:DNA-binding beta-propeller fold protein YncE